jgi:hypothetical protein
MEGITADMWYQRIWGYEQIYKGFIRRAGRLSLGKKNNNIEDVSTDMVYSITKYQFEKLA